MNIDFVFEIDRHTQACFDEFGMGAIGCTVCDTVIVPDMTSVPAQGSPLFATTDDTIICPRCAIAIAAYFHGP